MQRPLLRLTRLAKSFGPVAALKPVDLDVHDGEILGLVGENGAGKSTLINLLAGVHRPDGGTIEWTGVPLGLATPRDALAAGIATIHQELAYCGHLSIAENMLLGRTWPRFWWGGVDWRALNREAQRQLASFGLQLDARQRLETLTPAQRQDVAIATALGRDARLLILDEPTAALSEPEVERLFAHLEQLRERGVAMIYVSHRLDEVFRLTDRVAVLRDGRLVAVQATSESTPRQIVHEMVGRPLDQVFPHTRGHGRGAAVLEVENISRNGMFRNVSLQLHAGEIVGLGGLVGAGRSELARSIYGMYSLDGGRMQLRGRAWQPTSPRDTLDAGVIYLPEERKAQGLVLEHTLGETLSIGFSDLLTRFGLIDRRREQSTIVQMLSACDVRPANPSQGISTLSGGNQQKALLARWLAREPDVLLLDEPTRGVDVGAKARIHELIDRLVAAGKAILLISSDLPELVGMSDRVLVMNRGTIDAELSESALTEQNIILAASGLYSRETAE